ncbi:MAG: DUF952 domain-containing protein [Planctomycetes bacterium]|nr:DUF952 domain-containing protein [Planctomycetota bacterium]
MLIYKVLRGPEWATMQAAGEFAGSAIDLADGFVHLSSATQVEATAARHFAGQEDLWLLAVPAEALGDSLRWEPSRGGALFPHLYRALRVSEVHSAKPLPLAAGRHRLPDGWNSSQA